MYVSLRLVSTGKFVIYHRICYFVIYSTNIVSFGILADLFVVGTNPNWKIKLIKFWTFLFCSKWSRMKLSYSGNNMFCLRRCLWNLSLKMFFEGVYTWNFISRWNSPPDEIIAVYGEMYLSVFTFLLKWNFIPGWNHFCWKETDRI